MCSAEYIDRMKAGLQHWVDGGNKGHLQWGILHFRKVLKDLKDERTRRVRPAR